MTLRERPVLLIDCQTTGMHPRSGHLLEIAWAVTHALSTDALPIHSYLVKLPEGQEIPARISAITGIREQDMIAALAPEQVYRLLLEDLRALGDDPWAVIHYAQFEKAFLEDLFRSQGAAGLPFKTLCTHQIAKKLFPRLPSQNIRGLSGHFGAKFEEFKRAAAHVEATALIWRGTAEELENKGVTQPEQVADWMRAQPKAKSESYQYRVDRLKRLELPKSPGIYRMLSKTGEVLYVGKATSLKDRVNSYFRGRKGRDKRKLEMLAQVWDLEIIECPTPLEAALMETDEIKRLNPPYNVSLKAGRRLLTFYSRDFEKSDTRQDAEHPIGPFRPANSIEQLRLLRQSLEFGVFTPIFFDTIENSLLTEGFDLFLQTHGLSRDRMRDLRAALAFGMRRLREHEKTARLEDEPTETVEDADNDEAEITEDPELTATDVAEKFERLFRRAAGELRRAKVLTRLLNARIRWETTDGQTHWIEMQSGQKITERAKVVSRPASPWKNLDIGDYDRMSVLLSEISKFEHQIEK